MPRTILSLPSLESRPKAEWEARGWWGREPLWRRVRDRAAAQPEKMAVIDETGSLTYGELWEAALDGARALRGAGLRPGEIVLTQLPNWREYVIVLLASEVSGAVFSFCPIKWGARECARALDLLRPRLWVTCAEFLGEGRIEIINAALEAAAEPVEPVLVRGGAREYRAWSEVVDAAPAITEEEATANAGTGLYPLEIAVTSGTTGYPKGVVHAHDTALDTVQSTIDRQDITGDDVIHLALPVGHTFGYFYGVRCALQAGGTVLLQERWEPGRMAELARAHGVTVSLGTAAFIIDLLGAGADVRRALDDMWLFTQSGDALPGPVVERANKELPFRISRALGMTEFGHVTSTDAASPVERIFDSAGSAQAEIEIHIADEKGERLPPGREGRILVRGPAVCAGYLRPDGTIDDVVDDDGFFDTGDLGRLDEEGYLRITGRLKNLLRRGAETLPVADLEDVLSSHPNVVHSVIVGLPDARLGDLPIACVELRPGASLTMDDVREWFGGQGITRKFWPTDIHLVSDWPTGPTGKSDRRLLLAEYREAVEAM
ncbi:MAG: AMP-binding protein [Rhodospirillales bacterium]|jgi:acyl-CoA synthetase (AMP-forming)/AMP-acid ligase II|nr:AMP-binding protein [Rhodospirillales bacterium]MDP6774373.1 AMP-binding protein [Rhodospirillales bacterium]